MMTLIQLKLIQPDLEKEKMSIAQFVRKKRQEILNDLQSSYKGDELIMQYIDYLLCGNEHNVVSKKEIENVELPTSGKHYKEFLKRYQEADYNERTLYGKHANKMEVWASYIDDLVTESVDRQIKSILVKEGYDVENLWRFDFTLDNLKKFKTR